MKSFIIDKNHSIQSLHTSAGSKCDNIRHKGKLAGTVKTVKITIKHELADS